MPHAGKRIAHDPAAEPRALHLTHMSAQGVRMLFAFGKQPAAFALHRGKVREGAWAGHVPH